MGELENLKVMVGRILDGTILGTPAKAQPGKPPKAPKASTLLPAGHVLKAGGGRIPLGAQNSAISIDIQASPDVRRAATPGASASEKSLAISVKALPIQVKM